MIGVFSSSSPLADRSGTPDDRLFDLARLASGDDRLALACTLLLLLFLRTRARR